MSSALTDAEQRGRSAGKNASFVVRPRKCVEEEKEAAGQVDRAHRSIGIDWFRRERETQTRSEDSSAALSKQRARPRAAGFSLSQPRGRHAHRNDTRRWFERGAPTRIRTRVSVEARRRETIGGNSRFRVKSVDSRSNEPPWQRLNEHQIAFLKEINSKEKGNIPGSMLALLEAFTKPGRSESRSAGFGE